MDTVLRALPPAERPKRLYLPFGVDPALASQQRAEGWVTVAGLTPEDDPAGEARRLGCTAWLSEHGIETL